MFGPLKIVRIEVKMVITKESLSTVTEIIATLRPFAISGSQVPNTLGCLPSVSSHQPVPSVRSLDGFWFHVPVWLNLSSETPERSLQ